jgi:phosphatidyl-myo-inositol dimannoside synthase
LIGANHPKKLRDDRSKRLKTGAKVLALATDAFGGYGGIAQYNRDFVHALAVRDEIDAIDISVRLAPLPIGGLPEKVTQGRALMNPSLYALRALAGCINRPPNIIFNGHLYHGPFALLLARATGAQLISQVHGTEIWAPLPRKHLAPLAHSDLVLCVSRDSQRRVLEQLPRLSGKTFVLPNMVGPGFCPGDRHAARNRFNIGPEKVILTVARLDDRQGYKGHDRIIAALPQILNDHRDRVRYLIAGQGPDRGRLETLARATGVEHAVRFMGRVEDECLPDLYRASDLFAMPSTGEGFGIVYLEAMACGTPALGVNIGGVSDAFADGELGPCPNLEDFAAALRRALMAPPPDRSQLSAKVHARFGADAFKNKLGNMMERLRGDRKEMIDSPAFAGQPW